jgi:hypothetical protein
MTVNTSNICLAVCGACRQSLPAEGDLGDLLSRAEAVINGATRKTLLPETLVNSAAEIRSQTGTCLPGSFVDREVRRR